MRRSFKVILFSLVTIFVAGGIVVFFNFNKTKCSLFDFSIIDVMALLTSVVIGFGLTYLISVSLSKESKRNEIAIEIINAIKDDFAFIMQQLVKRRNIIIDNNIRSYFLLLSKNTDKDIAILKEIYEKNSYPKKIALDNLLIQRSNFNYILTGDDLVADVAISEQFVDECAKKYYLIKQALFQCKFEIYNI